LKRGVKPVCHLLALIGAHHIFHVSGFRVNVLTVMVVSMHSGYAANNIKKLCFILIININRSIVNNK